MSLLIDGYNFLHATDIFGRGSGSFQKTREALLSFLATSLNEKERSTTTVVFDATDAPPGLPDRYNSEQMQIRFARNYPDADTLLEEIIEAHPAPRGLTVVSSDHRVQRAARRRGASYVDSDVWYSQLWQRRVELRRQQQKSVPEKPIGNLSAAEIEQWVKQFDDDQLPELPISQSDSVDDVDNSSTSTFENPFPPGYADDLFEEDNQ